MWRGTLVLVFVLGGAFSSAYSAAYEDFSRGISASNRQDDDQAISLFSSALAAGDLSASLQPVAYFDRGRAYLRGEQCERALADFSAALKLRPDYREALTARADADTCVNNLAAAIDDLTTAIKLLPAAPAYFARARLRYFSRDFTDAADDLSEAIKLEPDYPYVVIWLGLARLRAGTFDARRFAHDVSQLHSSEWPYPILLLLQGNCMPESVMSLASRDGDKGKECEADFYIAEWHLS